MPAEEVLKQGSVQISQQFFLKQLNLNLLKHVRPPVKKDLGKNLRKSKPFATSVEVLNSLFSTANGLPEVDASLGIERDEHGLLKPTTSRAMDDIYKVKLSKPEHLKSSLRLEKRDTKRGLYAAKLCCKKAMGKTGKVVAMAAGPFSVTARIPKGKAALTAMGSMTFKTNVVTLDENATVHFGVKEYEPWVRCTPTPQLAVPQSLEYRHAQSRPGVRCLNGERAPARR